jgi:DNA-binding PadR family transcriptional regulator
MKMLSRVEELVLLSVWNLGEKAYGVEIRRFIIETTGEDWSIGAVYVPLDRLVKWGYLSADLGEPTPERGGRRKRYFKLTRSGLQALQHTRRVRDSLWSGLPEPEPEGKG